MALMGTKMLPNTRNSNTKVDAAIHSPARGGEAEDGLLGVDELGRRATDQHLRWCVDAADRLDQRFAFGRHRFHAGHDREPLRVALGGEACGGLVGVGGLVAVDVAAGAGVDAGDAVDGGELAGVRRHVLGGAGVGDDDAERGRLVGRELVAQHFGDLAGGGIAGEDPIVRQAEVGAQERQAQYQQDDDDPEGHGDGTAHDPAGDAVPHAALFGPGFGLAAVAPDGHGVDLGAQDGQQRRQADHRGDGRQQHHSDAGVGERTQEVQREHQQRGQRHGHGQCTEEDGAPRGVDGADHRCLDVVAVAHLLAEPRHDEQAVVDGQPQTQSGGDVDREDRHIGERRQQAQCQERAHHGHDPDRQRESSLRCVSSPPGL